MPRFGHCLLTLLLLLGLSHRAVAENGVPKITVMLIGTDEFLDDIKFITLLAGEKGKKEWPNVKGTLDYFLSGVDGTKPIRVDVLTGGANTETVLHVPIGKKKGNDFADFRTNLGTFGFAIAKQKANLFKLTLAVQPPQIFWMRYQNGYASIAEKQAHVPANIPNPSIAVQPLVKRGFDVAANLENAADGQDSRKKQFQSIRDNLTDALKLKKDEEADEFEIRKLVLDQQLDELQRFYVQSEKMILGWTTDVAKKEGWLDIELTPIKDTELDKSVNLFNNAASFFVNVERNPNAILSARLNHPLDEMRKAHLLEFFKLIRPNTKRRIDKGDKRTDDEKTARKQITDLMIDLLEQGTDGGIVDGFLEVTQIDEKKTLVGGIKIPDGAKAFEIMKLVTAAAADLKVKLEIEKVGDVSIHSVSIPEDDKIKVQELLGKIDVFYAGTSKDSLWIAAGDKALESLKAAIEKVRAPAKEGVESPAVETFVKLGPWIKYLDKRRQRLDKENAGKELTEPEKTQRKESDQRRQNALKSFAEGHDTITFQLNRVDKHIEGKLIIGEGIFRFMGNEIAKFSEETLQ